VDRRHEWRTEALIRLPLRGQLRLECVRQRAPRSSCFPFNCAGWRAGASTNGGMIAEGPEGAFSQPPIASISAVRVTPPTSYLLSNVP